MISFGGGYPTVDILLQRHSLCFDGQLVDDFVFGGGGDNQDLSDQGSSVAYLQGTQSPLAIYQDPSTVQAPQSMSVVANAKNVDGQSPESAGLANCQDLEATPLPLEVAPAAKVEAVTVAKSPPPRSSVFRGVTRHRWTGRYEAHLWDNTCRREGQKRNGRQVYLGGYDKEERAARAYDLAALKYWGSAAKTNFPVSGYSLELGIMANMTKQEFVASIRRNSSGFSRGASIYRGVTRHHQQGRWQARIGRVAGNKDLYLGTFHTEVEAAEAYDVAAIKFRGAEAVTNFERSRYNLEFIANNELPIGMAGAKRLKDALQANNPELIAIGNSDASFSVSTMWPKLEARGNNSPQLAVASASSMCNHEVGRYDVKGLTSSDEIPLGALVQFLTDSFHPNPEASMGASTRMKQAQESSTEVTIASTSSAGNLVFGMYDAVDNDNSDEILVGALDQFLNDGFQPADSTPQLTWTTSTTSEYLSNGYQPQSSTTNYSVPSASYGVDEACCQDLSSPSLYWPLASSQLAQEVRFSG